LNSGGLKKIENLKANIVNSIPTTPPDLDAVYKNKEERGSSSLRSSGQEDLRVLENLKISCYDTKRSKRMKT